MTETTGNVFIVFFPRHVKNHQEVLRRGSGPQKLWVFAWSLKRIGTYNLGLKPSLSYQSHKNHDFISRAPPSDKKGFNLMCFFVVVQKSNESLTQQQSCHGNTSCHYFDLRTSSPLKFQCIMYVQFMASNPNNFGLTDIHRWTLESSIGWTTVNETKFFVGWGELSCNFLYTVVS